jgi:hypothetical protein
MIEHNLAISDGIQGVISTSADIHTGVNTRTSLSHKDMTSGDNLPTELLDAEAL